ncbi:hypothetical protein RvY_17296 [Ramazzottius varieornatus]|uniref:Uncharacterized protein n=1 Tax=Ramazzottius varieornatus TaxID=947166 RepID=A0A1D1W2G4_RAMVA|nr:hypothetical protein RvY_17296 [Ramazzottius varieornatus]
MKQYCQNSCSFVVSNGQPINNDPYYGQVKVLQVSFTCGGDENEGMRKQLTAKKIQLRRA